MCRPVNAFRGLGVETGRRTSSARLRRIACGGGTPNVSKRQRRRSESNRRIEVLQTSALPLGYGAATRKLASYFDFLNPPPGSSSDLFLTSVVPHAPSQERPRLLAFQAYSKNTPLAKSWCGDFFVALPPLQAEQAFERLHEPV